mmetsp:Transcript_40946/g.98021  ORF Transcript_40946/g.98021 Transcript_40946/m.98021 type:complete len:106 (+) Transcript_40946:105-422(+)
MEAHFKVKANTVELVLIIVASLCLAAASAAVTWKLLFGNWPWLAQTMADNNDDIELGHQNNAPLVPHPAGGVVAVPPSTPQVSVRTVELDRTPQDSDFVLVDGTY